MIIGNFKKTTMTMAKGMSLNKDLTGTKMTAHDLCIIIPGTFLCHPLQNNNVKWPNFVLSGEHQS